MVTTDTETLKYIDYAKYKMSSIYMHVRILLIIREYRIENREWIDPTTCTNTSFRILKDVDNRGLKPCT